MNGSDCERGGGGDDDVVRDSGHIFHRSRYADDHGADNSESSGDVTGEVDYLTVHRDETFMVHLLMPHTFIEDLSHPGHSEESLLGIDQARGQLERISLSGLPPEAQDELCRVLHQLRRVKELMVRSYRTQVVTLHRSYYMGHLPLAQQLHKEGCVAQDVCVANCIARSFGHPPFPSYPYHTRRVLLQERIEDLRNLRVRLDCKMLPLGTSGAAILGLIRDNSQLEFIEEMESIAIVAPATGPPVAREHTTESFLEQRRSREATAYRRPKRARGS